MMIVANRLIVFAAGTIAVGAAAFGQTRMTAQIPFAFRTANGTLPAGTYEIDETHNGGSNHVVILRNTASQKAAFAGYPMYNEYRKAPGAPVVEFACVDGDCSLKAIRTASSSLEYNAPGKSRHDETKVAVVSVPLKTQKAE